MQPLPTDTPGEFLLRAIRNEDDWPRWPYLPVTRSVNGSSPAAGFIYAGLDVAYVFTMNIYAMPKEGYLRDLPRIEYDSFEALAADGWKVD